MGCNKTGQTHHVTLIIFNMHVEIYKLSFSPTEVLPVMPCQQISKVQISAAALTPLLQSSPLADPSVGTADSRDQITVYALSPESLSQLHPRRDLQDTSGSDLPARV